MLLVVITKDASGTWGVKARNTAPCPALHHKELPPTTKSDLAPRVSSTEFEKPSAGGQRSHWKGALQSPAAKLLWTE